MSQIGDLKAYAREASIALMSLSGGGSEMFKRIGEEFYAEPDLCVEQARAKLETARKLGTRTDLERELGEAANDAVATMAAVRASAGSDDWGDSAKHFFDLCGETIQRVNEVLAKYQSHTGGEG